MRSRSEVRTLALMKAWYRHAAAGALGTPRVVLDRTVLADEGHPASTVYFLHTGAAEIFHVSSLGFSVVVKLVTAPTILASPEVLVAEPVYRASIRAAGSARVFRLNRSRYLQLLRDADSNLEAMVDIALAFNGAAQMESSRLCSTENLLATLFLAYAEVFGAASSKGLVIGLRRSQADLAEAVGAAERSVNRVIARWKEDGIVLKERGRYRVLDLPRLRELAEPLGGAMVHRWRAVP